jgi:YHS domain-containing protein
MRPDPEPDALIDPVCGAAVGLESLFRRAHGGALYCFCSARCLDAFALDPFRFVALVAARDSGAAQARSGTPDAQARAPLQVVHAGRRGASPGTFPTLGGAEDDSERPATQSAARVVRFPLASAAAVEPVRPTTGTASGTLPGTGRFELLAGLFPWRERRFARSVSRELLKLYRIVSAAQPGLRGRDLYRRIIIARSRADPDAADALIDQAEESFAAWPVRRAVKFCDVVHFVVVSEFLASHGNSAWIHANVGREVASEIPDDL